MTMADLGVKTATKEKLKLKEPEKYDVVFLNDDVTTVEFVIKVLMQIFHKTSDQATKITQHIHEKGKGVVGTYLYEIAEQKALETTHLARNSGHPLNVEIETA